MTIKEKTQAFEFVVFKLINWYKLQNSIIDDTQFNLKNDLNKLKVIKLHFFVSAVNSKTNSLLTVFNNFYAMPYGHVESDIYSNWNKFEFYRIENKNLTILRLNLSENDFALSEKLKSEVSEAIDNLTKINSDLINYNSLQLVELSHKWFSWRSMFSYAKSNYRYSEYIPSNLIIEENKTFELSL
ncbi:type II toxin-antitoxin system antitoxin SocA domain-containing protein [Flavobacterium collinsii]|uniref:Antitoxin SocA-like Panacea domain-containing protein n=1 Tax=Flavobacterium collinsii TaxID=1114861 RepID=A0A9W4X5K9_9FLAO|nr:type II toxin-antitoxin system antitoxin SocA domain-containing protein [Flavobacterium collinsii]CAI2766139.1 conserved protein of unknown function [Flavobacterium collinsii]